MTAPPLVSVVMPVHNVERYLEGAIESILNQTFRHFEFIVIDGSTDATSAILASYQQIDDRIRVYHQENLGLIASLNMGCRLARGKYIARMDADDVSLPERLERQVYYLEEHPEIGVLGTWVEVIDRTSSSRRTWRTPTSPSVIGWSLIFGNCLAHPSIMIRRKIIERLGFYHPETLHVEDYDLWTRANTITQLANIPKVMLQLRVWEGCVSSLHSKTQEENAVKIMRSMITRLLGLEISNKTVANLRRAILNKFLETKEDLREVDHLITHLHRSYVAQNKLDTTERDQVAEDAARRLVQIALKHVERWPISASWVMLQALSPNWCVLTRWRALAIRTYIKRLVRYFLKTALQGKR